MSFLKSYSKKLYNPSEAKLLFITLIIVSLGKGKSEENSELEDLEPSEIDIKIPKKFSKSQIKKIDLVVKI